MCRAVLLSVDTVEESAPLVNSNSATPQSPFSKAHESAVRLDPFSFLAVFELGEVYRLLDRVSQAIRAFVHACELEPNDFDARFRLASCYHRTGDLDEALEAYLAALEINSDNAYAWTNLGAVYDSQGKYYEAIRAYKEALERNTNQPIVLINLATAYLHQQRWSTARKALKKAIEMDGRISIAHERYGYCLWREQKLDEAAQSYLRAISIDRKNAAAFAGYGAVRVTQYLIDPQRSAYRDEAIEAWHTSLEIHADQPRLRALIEKYRPRGLTAPSLIGPPKKAPNGRSERVRQVESSRPAIRPSRAASASDRYLCHTHPAVAARAPPAVRHWKRHLAHDRCSGYSLVTERCR